MHSLAEPVSAVMAFPVHTIGQSHRLKSAEQMLAELGVSALPVVNSHRGLIGVISRTDLLRAGRVQVTNGHRKKVLTLPDAPVREFMSTTVEVIRPDMPVHEAARRMVRQRLHRLYVAEDTHLQGVFSTHELLAVVADARVRTPIQQIMRSGLVVVQADDPVSLAVDRMGAAHVHGLVVVEDSWPVGMFTQAEALSARDADPQDPVEAWMDPSILCLPLALPVQRAAEQAHASRARTVLAVDAKGVRGIVTALDIASLIKHV